MSRKKRLGAVVESSEKIGSIPMINEYWEKLVKVRDYIYKNEPVPTNQIQDVLNIPNTSLRRAIGYLIKNGDITRKRCPCGHSNIYAKK